MTGGAHELALLGAMAMSGLVGSAHCVGMCGPIAVVATTPLTVERRHPSATRRAIGGAACFAAGRLAAYSVLGALAGALGGVVDLAGAAAGMQRPAIVGAALGIAIITLASARPRASSSPCAAARLGAGLARHGERTRAMLLGMITAALPCGWLWANLAIAGATARPTLGALAMAAFWLGTMPAMGLVGLGWRRVAESLPRPVARTAPILLVGLSFLVLAHRWAATRTVIDGVKNPVEVCHGGRP